jgi:hypothetical protein
MVYPATLGVDCQLSITLVFAYLLLGNPFSGFLTGSRQHGLGYLQGAVECWWLAAGVSSHVTAVICPMVAHATRSATAEDFGALVQAFVT